MSTEAYQQAQNYLKTAATVAVLLPEGVNLDGLAAAVATHRLLVGRGASASIFSSATRLPELPFLNEPPQVRNQFSSSDEFSIKISTAKAQPSEIRYEMEPDGVVVYLKTKSGQFSPSDVQPLPVRQKFDLLITLGAKNPEQLGGLYTNNASVFFGTPHLNIDVNPTNEYFGTVNIVEVTASSLSEIIFELAQSLPSELMDVDTATALLAGIVERTQSFRDPITTPKTLAAGAALIEKGAKQSEIIQYLFKTKPFNALQLWGRSLARLSAQEDISLLHTVLTGNDFEKTQLNEDALPGVLHDLVEMITGYSVVALVADLPSAPQVVVAGLPHAKISEILSRMGAAPTEAQALIGKYEFASGVFPGKTIAQVEQSLLLAARQK